MPEGPGPPSESALFELVYDELRRLASSYLRQERMDHTLQTSALVMRLTYGWPVTGTYSPRTGCITCASPPMPCGMCWWTMRADALLRSARQGCA